MKKPSFDLSGSKHMDGSLDMHHQISTGSPTKPIDGLKISTEAQDMKLIKKILKSEKDR